MSMQIEQNQTTAPEGARVLRSGIGLPGRTAVSWAVGGGLLLGGFLVAGMTLAGRLSGHALLLTSGGLFLIGGILGFLHGGVLGYLGRPDGMSPGQALRGIVLSAVYAIPALAVSWVVAGWLALTIVALYTHKVAGLTATGLAWAIGIALVITAGVQGFRSLRNGYARWGEARAVGTLIVASTFAALLVTFLAERPEIWGIHMRVTQVGAVLLAAAGTLWLAGPLVTLALRWCDGLPDLNWKARILGASGAKGVTVGLITGAVLALLALPFYGTAFGAPPVPGAGNTVSAAVVAVSTAIVNEVLLRLFLVTGVAWLVLRTLEVRQKVAAVIAVAVATLVQVLLYLPAEASIGFPNSFAAFGYLLATVAIPAAVFGILYWRRGLVSALTADAAAVLVLALLAV